MLASVNSKTIVIPTHREAMTEPMPESCDYREILFSCKIQAWVPGDVSVLKNANAASE